MTYRVEISARAENDAEEILEWLLARHAGETGLRWFSAMEDAITSLATFPERCPLAPESTQSRLRCVNSSTAISRTCTEFCSPFRKAQSTSFISVTVGASQLRDVRQAHFSQRTREMGHPAGLGCGRQGWMSQWRFNVRTGGLRDSRFRAVLAADRGHERLGMTRE